MDSKKPVFDADEAEEYFTMLCTSYRDTANDIFKRDNEGRHASEYIWSAEYQKYLGMQIAMREVLEYFSKFELVSVKQQPNAPLTLVELRKMDGEPVWLNIGGGVWGLVDTSDFIAWLDRGGFIALDRLSGKVYRRKPADGA